jgi:hypothetical protein
MRVLMWRMRRAARRERGFVDFHVIVGVGGPIENGARRIGSILMNGEGVEGFGERLNGGERPICCARGGRGECGGGGEGRKREAERAARSVHGQNGTPDGRVSAWRKADLHGVGFGAEFSVACRGLAVDGGEVECWLVQARDDVTVTGDRSQDDNAGRVFEIHSVTSSFGIGDGVIRPGLSD